MGDQNAVSQAIVVALKLAQSAGPMQAIAMLQSRRDVLADPNGQNVLGALLLQTKQLAPALAAFDAAVKLAPSFADAHCNLGVVLQHLGRPRDAMVAYEAALRVNPQHALALFNRGNILKVLGRLEDAIAAFDALLAVAPQMTEGRINRGLVQLDREQFEQGLSEFDAVLAMQPANPRARIGRASALIRLHRFDEARADVEGTLAADPTNREAQLLRVGILIEDNRLAEALTAVEAIISRDGVTAQALTAQSAVLWKLGRFGDAVATREEAVRLDPTPMAQEALAYLYLTRGDFARGFAAYEGRLRRLGPRQRAAELGAPRWRGEDLAGKRLLVLTEQGLGDTIQFSRYLPLVAQRGASVTAISQPAALPVMRSLPAPVDWRDSALKQGRFDYHTPLLSLPHIFGTTLETVPANVPYLAAEPARVAHWRGILGARGEGAFKVGIVWQGSTKNLHDKWRSVALRYYAPLASVRNVRLISLQAVNGLEQLQSLPDGMHVETLGERLTSNPHGIAEVAAAIECVDLVITSDTMTAHLAGALAAPVWVALRLDADWRWLQERSDSPWYPTMRLFRQKREGDWEAVFAEIAAALKERVATA